MSTEPHTLPAAGHPPHLHEDLASIRHIAVVPSILAAMARLTGMRFAAVARVTDTQWIACAVRDELGFGLPVGGELELETTLCNEIRQHRQPVVFADARTDPMYAQHHTTRQYGLESYISVPILRNDGAFFGTLCAIDNRPAEALADPATLEAVQLFAQVIGNQIALSDDLDAMQQHLRQSRTREQQRIALERSIRELLSPLVTHLYLLRNSTTLSAEDRQLADEMDDGCQALLRLLRQTLDTALEQGERQAD